MKKITVISILFFSVCSWNLSAQQDLDLSILTLPQELTKNANAVVRDHKLSITIEAADKIIIKKRYVATIFNKIGHEKFTNTAAFYDPDSKVKNISAKFYNSLGKEIKKFTKNKFTDVSAVSNGSLYDDNRVLFVEYTPVSYPFTLFFEVETVSRTTGFIPRWYPLPSYYLGVQKSTYRIINKTDSKIRIKEKFFNGYDISKKELENGFEYQITNLKPLKHEAGYQGVRQLTPKLLVALNTFALKGVKGTAGDWNEYGKWMYDKLIEGRAELDEATKSKIKSMVSGIKSPLEKAKIVYDFVQNKTRYISVQVGIGGWEPIAANRVDKLGYGDCKGLTNYTKALLDVVGVNSYYTIVYGGSRRDIENDFAMMQGNHAILNIPIGEENYWLECTSQTLPFGFLGDFTDNRDVLVITPEGGVIKRTPAYLNEDNLQITKATIELNPEGSLNADVDISSEGIRYDARYMLEKETPSEQKKYYKSDVWSYNNNLEVLSIAFDNNKDSVIFRESLEVSIADYATLNGSDYLLKVNAFDRNTFIPKRYRERKMPLKILRGYKDVSKYNYKIPEGYSIGVLPEPKIIETKFGMYKVVFQKLDDTTFTYAKTMLIKAGEYPKEEYKNYRRFRKSIAKYENIRILLTKKT